MSQRDFLDPYLEANWLTGERLRAYGWILLVLSGLAALGWVAASRGGIDPTGKVLGTDFVGFWAASHLALSGHAADVYVPDIQIAAEQAIFPDHPQDSVLPFFYPPPYLLLCLPLALLPYLASLAVWLGVTFALWWRSMRALLPGMAMPLLAFPAVLINLGHGQNGFLTAALFAGAARWLYARPLVAGLCLGGLVIKPHLLIMVPVALLAGRHWRVLLGSIISAAALSLASLAAFGLSTWVAFLKAGALARTILEQDPSVAAKMQSTVAAMRVAGSSLTLAYAVQAVVVLTAAVMLVQTRRSRDAAGKVSALVVATALATPYLFDYDLVMLSIPLACCLRAFLRTGVPVWNGEKMVLVASYLLPLLGRVMATTFLFSVSPVVLSFLMLMVIGRQQTGHLAARDRS